MNIRNKMIEISDVQHHQEICMTYPDVDIDVTKIKAIMINEVVASSIDDDFFGANAHPYYLQTTIPLFQEAGVCVNDMQDIVEKGIYITNVVRKPKIESAIETKDLLSYVPYLEKELSLFPNVEVIMLMGDVAKKAFNFISKQHTKKNVIPSLSTYKLRNDQFFYQGIQVLPSYIMTGKNILIEKSKFQMASEDIAKMMDIIR